MIVVSNTYKIYNFIGTGFVTTANRAGACPNDVLEAACVSMVQLNDLGRDAMLEVGAHAATDVTGFGLAGHSYEMAEGSGLSAVINFENVPLIIPGLVDYLDQKCVPGGTQRNWDSYGEKIGALTEYQKAILADPQTSGGLLAAVDVAAVAEVKNILRQ